MTVKGSKQHRVRVVAYRPVFQIGSRLLALLLIGVFVVCSYIYGFHVSETNNQQALLERDELRQQVRQQEQQISELKQRVANAKMGSNVDRESLEDLRLQIVELNNTINALEEINTFYRQLMEPRADRNGLTIGALNIVPTAQSRRYAYELVIQQYTVDHQLLKGNLQVSIVGKAGEVMETYALSQLSEQVESEKIKLRFKFYQTVEGELDLPPDFEPVKVMVVASKSGKKPVTVEKEFGWIVES